MDTRSHWPPSEHIARVQTLAQLGLNLRDANTTASTISGGFDCGAEGALQFWLTANLTNPDNWYPQRISTPRAIGIACLALQGQGALDTALGAACHMGMRGAQWDTLPPGATNISGANLLWIATCRTYDGVLLGNASHVAEATSRMWAELAITGGGAAGLKEDLGASHSIATGRRAAASLWARLCSCTRVAMARASSGTCSAGSGSAPGRRSRCRHGHCGCLLQLCSTAPRP